MAESRSTSKRTPDGPSLRRRALVAAGLVLLVIGGCAGLWAGFRALGRIAATSPAYLVSREDVSLVRGPAWMTPEMRAELDLASLAPEFPDRISLLDKDLCRRIADAYASSLWVERVEAVEKRDPRVDPDCRLVVRLKFRRPVAFIRDGGAYCLVDEQGVRLPGRYREPVLRQCGRDGRDQPLLVLAGVEGPAPRPGQVWASDALQAGLHVADGLTARQGVYGLRVVDVSNVGYRRSDARPEVTVYTANRTEIRWGKAPTRQAALLAEKSIARKVEYLDYVYEQIGRFDGVLDYIDIPNEVIRRRTADGGHRVRS